MNWSNLYRKNRFLLASVSAVFVLAILSFQTKNYDDVPTDRKYTTENVIILVIDGPRMSETFGDSTYKYIPNLANVLAPQGVLLKNFRNNGPTYTNAGHTAITTGVYQRINNSGLELPKNPSIFQYFLKEKGLSKESAWIIASKGKLNILANTKNKKWRNQYTPSSFCGVNGSGLGYTADEKNFSDALRILGQYHPKLTLINLLEVDVNGHANLWEGYLKAIQRTDQKALELWNFIENDSIYKGKTTLFITNDHGRHSKGHKDGFVSHGDNCEGCRSIYLIALGPDFKKNSILPNRYEQIDISKTIAEMLYFEYPVSQGKVMTDIFK
jgi:predicted AlkP superfamily pyrophosphatase or phosphodiesterase